MKNNDWENNVRKIVSYSLSVILIISVIVIISLIIYRDISDGAWYAIAKEHFAATIGLPFAGFASFILVRAFESNNNKISFTALGVKLEGKACSVILWVIVFLSIVVAVKLLW